MARRSSAQHEVLLGAERGGHPARGVELAVVPLAVVERERVAVEALGPRDREGGGRVEAAREQDHRAAAGIRPPAGRPRSGRAAGARSGTRGPCRPRRATGSARPAPRRRRPSGCSSTRSRGSAKRSVSRSTSPISPGSLTTNFHQASRARNARIAPGLIRRSSATPGAGELHRDVPLDGLAARSAARRHGCRRSRPRRRSRGPPARRPAGRRGPTRAARHR